MRRIALLVTAVAAVAAVAACGGTASPTPSATPDVTPGPFETARSIAPGPLNAIGPLERGTYETPPGFTPAFTFDVRVDGWQSVAQPDEFGFALARPNLANADAIAGVLVPRSETFEAFLNELEAGEFISEDAEKADLTLDGVTAHSLTVNLPEPREAFIVVNADGESLTAFGGEFAENRVVYVDHPDRPFVVLLSLGPAATVEDRFSFEAMLETIDFR